MRGEREGAAANMTCVTAIDAAWIPALAEGSPLLSFSDPLVSPPPTYDHEKTHAVMCRCEKFRYFFGEQSFDAAWIRRACTDG